MTGVLQDHALWLDDQRNREILGTFQYQGEQHFQNDRFSTRSYFEHLRLSNDSLGVFHATLQGNVFSLFCCIDRAS